MFLLFHSHIIDVVGQYYIIMVFVIPFCFIHPGIDNENFVKEKIVPQVFLPADRPRSSNLNQLAKEFFEPDMDSWNSCFVEKNNTDKFLTDVHSNSSQHDYKVLVMLIGGALSSKKNGNTTSVESKSFGFSLLSDVWSAAIKYFDMMIIPIIAGFLVEVLFKIAMKHFKLENEETGVFIRTRSTTHRIPVDDVSEAESLKLCSLNSRLLKVNAAHRPQLYAEFDNILPVPKCEKSSKRGRSTNV